MLYAELHRLRGVGLAGAVHRTWAVAEKNDWQFSNPRIDTVCNPPAVDTNELSIYGHKLTRSLSKLLHKSYIFRSIRDADYIDITIICHCNLPFQTSK